MGKVTAKQQADAELVAEAVAQRCSTGSNKDGSPKAPTRHAIIWQAARLGALEYAAMTESDRTNNHAELVEALRPFAAMAKHLDDTDQRRDGLYCGGSPGILAEIKASDYHRARKALSLYGGEK
ncbi:hypothetical protein SKP52_02365 [Sphingopyxis fribergensis]|uniref:Uncharacterized protein n=1 Tax=Sphingopyxis fribergensis TaxID=1515612 RepID=A0A0A7PDU9_9SPHN|nr:hypothetical protein [Sphingopyxis fribergensis]AJA07408.1 hypothetical protein SKP52_02365 [Sphingopyxis fribergensis]